MTDPGPVKKTTGATTTAKKAPAKKSRQEGSGQEDRRQVTH